MRRRTYTLLAFIILIALVSPSIGPVSGSDSKLVASTLISQSVMPAQELVLYADKQPDWERAHGFHFRISARNGYKCYGVVISIFQEDDWNTYGKDIMNTSYAYTVRLNKTQVKNFDINWTSISLHGTSRIMIYVKNLSPPYNSSNYTHGEKSYNAEYLVFVDAFIRWYEDFEPEDSGESDADSDILLCCIGTDIIIMVGVVLYLTLGFKKMLREFAPELHRDVKWTEKFREKMKWNYYQGLTVIMIIWAIIVLALVLVYYIPGEYGTYISFLYLTTLGIIAVVYLFQWFMRKRIEKNMEAYVDYVVDIISLNAYLSAVREGDRYRVILDVTNSSGGTLYNIELKARALKGIVTISRPVIKIDSLGDGDTVQFVMDAVKHTPTAVLIYSGRSYRENGEMISEKSNSVTL